MSTLTALLALAAGCLACTAAMADASSQFAGASADGTRVFFTISEQLVAADTDTAKDVYERSAGTTKLVSAGEINGNRSERCTEHG